MRLLAGWTRGRRLAFAGCALSLAVLGWSAVDAHRIDRLPAAEQEAEGSIDLRESDARRAGIDPQELLAAVARDPFHPERRRPAGRYRLPGSRSPSPVSRRPSPTVRLHGLAAGPKRTGLAAVQIGGSPVRILRLGESHLGFELTDVRPDGAVLSGTDTTLVLSLSPWWSGASGSGGGDPSAGGRP